MNTLRNCGSGVTGHAAVMVFSDGSQPNDNVTLSANDIIQSGQDGIEYFGPQTNIYFNQNRITGAGTAYVGDRDANVTIIPFSSGAVGYVAS